MICVNQYKLLGFVSLFLAVGAWHEWWGHHEVADEPILQDDDDEIFIIVNEPQHLVHPLPEPVTEPQPLVHWLPEPAVVMMPMNPLQFKQVIKEEVIEQVFNEIQTVSFITRDTSISTVTTTDTLFITSHQRSTVTITPPKTQTLTQVVESVFMVEAAATRNVPIIIIETQFTANTTTKTQTRWLTTTTKPIMTVTTEVQTTETVWEPFTVTTTALQTVTESTTVPFDVVQVANVRIPVVSITTLITTIPHDKTMTRWVTQTTTSTMCDRRHRQHISHTPWN